MSVCSPIPSISKSCSGVWIRPKREIYSRIAFARAGPIPGSCVSSSSEAELMRTTSPSSSGYGLRTGAGVKRIEAGTSGGAEATPYHMRAAVRTSARKPTVPYPIFHRAPFFLCVTDCPPAEILSNSAYHKIARMSRDIQQYKKIMTETSCDYEQMEDLVKAKAFG